jgi:hypothetical protein
LGLRAAVSGKRGPKARQFLQPTGNALGERANWCHFSAQRANRSPRHYLPSRGPTQKEINGWTWQRTLAIGNREGRSRPFPPQAVLGPTFTSGEADSWKCSVSSPVHGAPVGGPGRQCFLIRTGLELGMLSWPAQGGIDGKLLTTGSCEALLFSVLVLRLQETQGQRPASSPSPQARPFSFLDCGDSSPLFVEGLKPPLAKRRTQTGIMTVPLSVSVASLCLCVRPFPITILECRKAAINRRTPKPDFAGLLLVVRAGNASLYLLAPTFPNWSRFHIWWLSPSPSRWPVVITRDSRYNEGSMSPRTCGAAHRATNLVLAAPQYLETHATHPPQV